MADSQNRDPGMQDAQHPQGLAWSQENHGGGHSSQGSVEPIAVRDDASWGAYDYQPEHPVVEPLSTLLSGLVRKAGWGGERR